jgi:hypothetical protein
MTAASIRPALFATGLLAAAVLHAEVQATPARCSAASPATPPAIVELYTSEGCSSCPPADRWLSTLKGRADVLPLAFHVGYWDRLGWPDRFALREGTDRQSLLAQKANRRQVYTPQVIVDGRDWRGWPALPTSAARGPVPQVALQRSGQQITAKVAATPAARGLAGYWVVVEDAHQTAVRAGENAGETLRHDHVVRLYQPLPGWAGEAGHTAQLTVADGVAQHPRRAVFVVTDGPLGAPLQAATLALNGGC